MLTFKRAELLVQRNADPVYGREGKVEEYVQNRITQVQAHVEFAYDNRIQESKLAGQSVTNWLDKAVKLLLQEGEKNG